ncbi:hypothetical protein [Bradyrhizobium sp. UFLA05-109]
MTATRISTIHKIGLILGLTLSMSTVVTSSSLAYSAKAQQMCMGDAFRLCSAEIPNVSRIVACMRRNRANLSQGCRLVMDQEDTAATKAKPAQAGPVEQRPTTASRVEPPAATETKPVQTAPLEQKPTTASPVEQPASSPAKPVQAAPVEQKPSTTTPVEVKPVEAKSASRSRPLKMAQRKQKHRELIVARQAHHEFRKVARAFGFSLPIPLVIQFYW